MSTVTPISRHAGLQQNDHAKESDQVLVLPFFLASVANRENRPTPAAEQLGLSLVAQMRFLADKAGYNEYDTRQSLSLRVTLPSRSRCRSDSNESANTFC